MNPIEIDMYDITIGKMNKVEIIPLTLTSCINNCVIDVIITRNTITGAMYVKILINNLTTKDIKLSLRGVI